jgi:hypothetical protein
MNLSRCLHACRHAMSELVLAQPSTILGRLRADQADRVLLAFSLAPRSIGARGLGGWRKGCPLLLGGDADLRYASALSQSDYDESETIVPILFSIENFG